MANKVADMFVGLGIKGADKTVGSLKEVKSGMGDLVSMSIEAKAAIVGALYTLEQLASKSMKAGNGFANFATLTGMSAESLQRWQYAARQVGVSGEEIEGSLKGVQNAMTNMLLGKGAPEGMAMLSNKVGFDMNKARDTFYVFGQLQKLAQVVPADVANNIMKSFGLSEGAIVAARKNAFNPAALARAPIYSEKEVGTLQKIDVAWSNLGQKIQMSIGHLNSKHGMTLINDISKITDSVMKMVDALVRLSEKLRIFEAFSLVFKGWGQIFGLANEKIDEWTGKPDPGKKGAKKESLESVLNKKVESFMDFVTGNGAVSDNKMMEAMLTAGPTSRSVGSSNHITVNQNITHNGDAKDTKAVKDVHRTSANHALRTNPALAGGI